MNKAERKEYFKAYREANKDKIAERNKAYYEANKDKIAEQKKAYREANKKYFKAYKKELISRVFNELYTEKHSDNTPLMLKSKHNSSYTQGDK